MFRRIDFFGIGELDCVHLGWNEGEGGERVRGRKGGGKGRERSVTEVLSVWEGWARVRRGERWREGLPILLYKHVLLDRTLVLCHNT